MEAWQLLRAVLTFLKQVIDIEDKPFSELYLKKKVVKLYLLYGKKFFYYIRKIIRQFFKILNFSFPTATWKKKHSGNILSLGRGNVLQEVCVKLL